jgi:N-acetyl sugar amidotransferase
MDRAYQICTKCVMDTTDPDIQFDAHGVCNHCHNYDLSIKRNVLTGEPARIKIGEIVRKLKTEGLNKPYDCVIGVSGGVDSTYTAYVVKNLGLRPLAVHVDNGWDSELAVKNIENVCNILDIDLHTIVLDWEEFRDIQLSFLKASTPDSEIPSDHAIISGMYKTAKELGINSVITGYNTKTESHLPPSWSQGHYDWSYINKVQKKFGIKEINSFPHFTIINFYAFSWRNKFVNILNYIDYTRDEAINTLTNKLGWKNYGGKHHESVYTRWYQGYWLPKKFGYDKRKVHFSSLICSGNISREEALQMLNQPSYEERLQEEDTFYVIKKLGISQTELDMIMKLPIRNYKDFCKINLLYLKSAYKFARFLTKIKNFRP